MQQYTTGWYQPSGHRFLLRKKTICAPVWKHLPFLPLEIPFWRQTTGSSVCMCEFPVYLYQVGQTLLHPVSARRLRCLSENPEQMVGEKRVRSGHDWMHPWDRHLHQQPRRETTDEKLKEETARVCRLWFSPTMTKSQTCSNCGFHHRRRQSNNTVHHWVTLQIRLWTETFDPIRKWRVFRLHPNVLIQHNLLLDQHCVLLPRYHHSQSILSPHGVLHNTDA